MLKAIGLMATFCGKRENVHALRCLSEEYSIGRKKLSEFSELDKIVYQNIKCFAKMV